jgi:hypothetical protein
VQRIVLMFAGSLAFLFLLGQLIDAPGSMPASASRRKARHWR